MTDIEKRQKNIKMYPFYKMFSWDFLFYYSIIFLFLTQEKSISAAEILFADAFHPISQIIFQLPCVGIVDWFGKRKSIIIGNILICFGLLNLIFAQGLISLILSNIIFAFGFNLKQMCESSILYNALDDGDKKAEIFSKLDGKGTSLFYYVDAISSALTGFLFVINGYIPIILCLIFFMNATIIAFNFESLENKDKNIKSFKTEKENFVNYFIELKKIFKFILNSKRLKSLLLFSGIFAALLTMITTLRSSMFLNLELPEMYFGVIVAILQFIAAISAKCQNFLHNILKNKTLTIFALSNTILLIIVGIVTCLHIENNIILFVVGIWLVIYSCTKGPYFTIIKRYLNNFSTPTVNTKIYATQTIFDALIRIPISLFASFILSISDISISFIIIGLTLSVLFVIISKYMKTRVGLEPSEYPSSDINYVEVK